MGPRFPDTACESHFLKNIVFFFDNFLCGPFLKSSMNLSQYCFYFIFWPGGMWDLSSLSRIQPVPIALEDEVLTTGPPGKSALLPF